jgi:hypothetical protein
MAKTLRIGTPLRAHFRAKLQALPNSNTAEAVSAKGNTNPAWGRGRQTNEQLKGFKRC